MDLLTILSRRQRALNAANSRFQGLQLPLEYLKLEICGGLTLLEPYRPPVLYLHQKLLIFSYDLHRAYRQLLQQMGGIDFCLKEYFINCALQKQHWHHQLEKIRTQAKSGKRPLPEYTLSVCNVFNISRYSWVDMITENKLNYHVLGTMESIADTVGMCWDRQQAGFQHQLSLFFRDAARGRDRAGQQ